MVVIVMGVVAITMGVVVGGRWLYGDGILNLKILNVSSYCDGGSGGYGRSGGGRWLYVTEALVVADVIVLGRGEDEDPVGGTG
ncbi:hypothetical protein M8C21_008257 [Ambrosia artemisiifolia]|uniref:Transmembrane protein n=1 Tax=Ambrosia artemisiifolia TaxID=4212 RepID=A0AAD5D2L1_AMBAR|nr:hypothetical protein M8C21_008257 [Ambrosia artemisiifolia]